MSGIDTALLVRLQAAQHLYQLAPETLLPLSLAAILIGKTEATARNDITRRPNLMPKVTRIGGRVYIRKSDIDAFIAACNTPKPRRRGRPTKAEQMARRNVPDAGEGEGAS